LAIDPAWIADYPDEINLIRKFGAKIRVLRDPDEPQLTKRARKTAARIAEHFGETHPSHPELKRQRGRGAAISPQAPIRQQEPGREHER
jgi:hypothetical protein